MYIIGAFVLCMIKYLSLETDALQQKKKKKKKKKQLYGVNFAIRRDYVMECPLC